MTSLKEALLITLPLTLLSTSTFAEINSEYSVSSITLNADHDESQDIPMAFYANGKMQSKLNVTVEFSNSSGQPVTVNDDELKTALSFYLKSDNTPLGLDRDCSYQRDCWGYTYNENDYVHQISSVSLNAENLSVSKVSSKASNKLTAWVYGTETAQYRQVCALIKFSDGNSYDSCAYPYDENAIYQGVQAKVYTASDFEDIGQGELVWEDKGDGFYFEKAEVRNFYITPKDASFTLIKVATDNFEESDSDYVFLDDRWLGCFDCGPNRGFRSAKGFIFVPGTERNIEDEYVWNSVVGAGRTATWTVNQRRRSVTLSQLLYSTNDTETNDSQREYRFVAFDQYGNEAALKLTYPKSQFSDHQEWDYTTWILSSQ